MNPSQPSILPVLFLFGTVIIAFLSFGRFLSYKSGWDGLALHYRQKLPFHGKRFRFCFWVVLGFTNYAWLTLGSSREGLEIQVPLLIRWGHPPLLVPWSAVRLKRQKVFGFEFWELHFPHERNGDGLWIRRGLGEKLLEASGLRHLRE